MKKAILIFVFLLALCLRIYKLSQFPYGFTADEAAQGYTAWSILKTGCDEWRVKFPLNPRSFGDFKPPLYTYLTITSIGILGLNEFAVRFPNALLGSLAVLLVYFLTKELFKNKDCLALTAALLLAISPWHVSLSRGAFEANLTTFFLTLAIFLFLLGLRHPLFLILSSFVFGLNLFTYHSAKFVTPLVLFFLLFLNRKKILPQKLITFVLIFSLFLGASFFVTLKGGGTRASDIGIFSGSWNDVAEARYYATSLGLPDFFARVFNNKAIFLFEQFFRNYFSYLSPQFFFTQGAGEATYGMIPGMGVLYLVELPFIIASFFYLFKGKEPSLMFLWLWVFASPIPAALARGVGYHANRVAVMMPAIQIISAYGALKIFEFLRKKFSFKLIFSVFTLILFFSLSLFLEKYFFQAPKLNGPVMGFGWKEIMSYVSTLENQYETIVVSRRFSEPQTMIAFFKKWEPLDFQENSKNWLKYQESGFYFVDQLPNYSLGKYIFKNFVFPEDVKLKKALFVGKEEDFLGINGNIKKIIYYPGYQKKIAAEIVDFQ